MKNNTQAYLNHLNKTLADWESAKHPIELYEPIRYIMQLEGKRMRPLLTLMAYAMFKEDIRTVIRPALAVEVFHNFTLVHDDIMDQAPLRRGEKTIHERWNPNTAILSGDVMFIKAYQLLMSIEDPTLLRKALQRFNECAIKVCEGQQLDMNFETRESVSEQEYLEMIALKTATLLGFSLELGVLLAGGDDKSTQLAKDFGVNIGIGFQLKDDLLDVYSDTAIFGKQVGGDIIANKKTFLLIKAMENAKGECEKQLSSWLTKESCDNQAKVVAITDIYNELNVKNLAEQKMNEYFASGFAALEKISVHEEKKSELKRFTDNLINRVK